MHGIGKLSLCAAIVAVCTVVLAAGGNLCPDCSKTMEDDWKFCPYDGTRLCVICPKCKREFPADHKFCPYDASPLVKPGAAPKKARPEKPAPDKVDKVAEEIAAELIKSKLSNPALTGEHFLKAVAAGDKDFLKTAILWDEFARNMQDPKKAKPAAEFRKLFLTDVISDRPSGVAGMFDVKLGGTRMLAKNFEISGPRSTITSTVSDAKTGDPICEITIKCLQKRRSWLVTYVHVKLVQK